MNLDTMTTEQLSALSAELYDAITAKLPKHVYRNRNGFKVQIGADYYGTFPTAAQAINHLANVTKPLDSSYLAYVTKGCNQVVEPQEGGV